ncbi:MAG TPA: hypothetical protein VGE74_26775 [Gemmata sp.]
MNDAMPAAPSKDQPPEAPVPLPPAAVPQPPPKNGRALLLVAAALFVGWMSWLGYTALTKSPAPIVSHAQAAGATVPVVAELTTGEDGRALMMLRRNPFGPEVRELKEKAERPAVVVKVVEALKGGPKAGDSIAVSNLPSSAGYAGPGTYLLLLNADKDALVENAPVYVLAGAQQPAGADSGEAGALRLYPWTDRTAPDLRKQVLKLFP